MSAENGSETPLESPEQTHGETAEHLPATVPDNKLTIQANRLAGSVHCLNCGTELLGPFCHYCGQPDKNLVRFFPALMREMLEDFVDFDSRFARTMKPLLARPGKLTRDYLDGRRFRYVPPMRLYIFSSLLMFFLAALLTGSGLDFTTHSVGDEAGVSIQIGEDDREDIEEAMRDLDEIRPGLGEQVGQQIEQAVDGQGETEDEEEEFDPSEITINGKPWNAETNPVVLPLMPEWLNGWINREVANSPQKIEKLRDDPRLIFDKALDVLPGTMFILLPLVALLFKFWYLFAKKYYVEHLIFALHNHAFIFVTFLIMMLMSVLAEWREPAGTGPVTSIVEWIEIGIFAWIPIYLLMSLKTVYRQGWTLTIAKYLAIGMSYMFLLTLATAFAGILSFVLL
jgi:hypothetical protein